jgi:hypothetical protein
MGDRDARIRDRQRGGVGILKEVDKIRRGYGI